ncbi:tripartite tricarboxylate transporter permease [uncultured Aeromicrobium sp.]|uniref:tripartite tricarboxylate transporter permease n=1 Tax=uncultured Aeromicrobium sp. TaxID=337820 RepID=UPI0026012BC4|nr:tripartite tricarboxylate transporter permease [uncultured Aeromicrobium sp.]
MTEIVEGFATAFTATNLLYCLIGVSLGTIIGMLPGLGSASGVGLLLPLTLGLEPVTALIMLAGIYYGTQYGGTISSVLIAAPGEAATAVTVLDGHAMARKGRAGQALAIAAIASFIAGVISLAVVMFVAPPLASVALEFGPPEMVGVLLLALVATAGIGSADRTKSLAMMFLGLVLATVGLDPTWGEARFTFGEMSLLGGVGFIEVVIGMFAIAEVLSRLGEVDGEVIRLKGWRSMLLSRRDLASSAGPIARGSALGTAMGVIPGAGSTLASFLAYGVERRVSRHREEFGHGAIEGVAGPEAANNAAANASFIPALSLGVPGSATTAVLLGALMLHGIQPGPLLIENEPVLVWGLLASFLIGNVILLIQNLPLAPLFASVLALPYRVLYPIILVLCLIGAFAVENNTFGMAMALIFGVVGYVAARHGFSPVALLLGLILGPLLEQGVSRSVAMGGGSLTVFLERPLALTLLALSAAFLLYALVAPSLKKRSHLDDVAERRPTSSRIRERNQ